jgi:hypothetical protein
MRLTPRNKKTTKNKGIAIARNLIFLKIMKLFGKFTLTKFIILVKYLNFDTQNKIIFKLTNYYYL